MEKEVFEERIILLNSLNIAGMGLVFKLCQHREEQNEKWVSE